MNNYFNHAYITTLEVKNPEHDRRKKYGPEAIASLPAGTVLFSFKAVTDTQISYYDSSGHSVAGPYTKFGQEITKNVEDFEPTDWQHLVVFKCGSLEKGILIDLISQLVETGAITVGQILRVSSNCIED